MKKTAFTLIELMVVVVIVGILATMSYGTYTKTITLSRARIAVMNLKIIYRAEQMYRSEEGTYYPTSGTKTPANFNPVLHTAIENGDFDYTIIYVAVGGYRAEANYRRQPYVGAYIRVNNGGTWTQSGWPGGFDPGWRWP